MSNLLKTELYKLFHSWYFWGIGIFNLLLSSILLLDSKERSSNLIMASLYNIPLLYFLSIVFIALFIGSDFSGRTLNTYITAGHKRSSIFRVKLIVSQIGCIIILVFPLFVHGIISQFYIGEKLCWEILINWGWVYYGFTNSVCHDNTVCITDIFCFYFS